MLPALLVLLSFLLAGVLGLFPTRNPTVNQKSKIISTVTTISADTVDCDEAAGYFEIPRGAENVKFTFLATLNTGYSAGSAFFKGYIVGAHSPGDTFTRVAGCVTGELVVDVAQQVPTAADAPGVVLPRFVKVEWDETGTMTSFTATCRIEYDLPAGAGRDGSPGYLGG